MPIARSSRRHHTIEPWSPSLREGVGSALGFPCGVSRDPVTIAPSHATRLAPRRPGVLSFERSYTKVLKLRSDKPSFLAGNGTGRVNDY
jgi:hypothetical protein